MKERIEEIFTLLDENGIFYYLLRPIDLNIEIEDLDIVVPEDQLEDLIELLLEKYVKLLFRKSHANASIQIVANNVLLDIKFSACFLHGKSLVVHESIPYARVKELQNGIIVPDVPMEVLFTFWTYHLFLDKKHPEQSSTIKIFKDFYRQDWKACTESEFFVTWSEIIFKQQYSDAISIVENYFKNDMVSNARPESISLKILLFKSRPLLRLKYIFDKFKYALFRRLGIHGNYQQITKATY